jgi:hypothetical protein
MIPGVKFAILLLSLSTLCTAQEGLTVHAKGKQKGPIPEAQKIYRSACSVVQREFGATHAVAPAVTLVLGADRNELAFDQREIRLTKWNPYLLAQGVVMLAFENLMSSDEKMAMAKRAVAWADATVEVERGSH